MVVSVLISVARTDRGDILHDNELKLLVVSRKSAANSVRLVWGTDRASDAETTLEEEFDDPPCDETVSPCDKNFSSSNGRHEDDGERRLISVLTSSERIM